MHLDLWTLGLQTINFLVLLWLLQRFLYRPVLKVIAARQAAADKLSVELQAEKAGAETARRDLEQQKQAIAVAREQVLAAARAEAETKRKALLEKAKQDAEQIVAQARDELQRQQVEAAQTLGRDASRLAVAVVRRLLQDNASEAVQQRMLDLIIEDVGALPAQARRHIRDRLVDAASRCEVIVARPLSEAAALDFAARLAKPLGAQIQPSFRVDPALLAGVELHFPFTVLRRTWADELQRIEAELAHDDAAQSHA
jgi:F-type H+-transporting ATPase subunit b